MDLKHIDNVTESLTLHANHVDKEADSELAQLLGHYSSLLLSTLLLIETAIRRQLSLLLRGEPPAPE